MIPIKESSGGVSFAIRVQPRARRNRIAGALGDSLKIAVTAPPVEGRANEAVIELFADLFQIPRSSVTIASGEISRNKMVRISGLRRTTVEQRLNEAMQSSR